MVLPRPDTPCGHHDGMPCEPCNELAEIDTQIEDLRSHLNDLQEQRCQVRVRRNHVHSLWIHRFPLEIVAYMFTIACSHLDTLHCSTARKGVSPLILGQVCHTWRDMVLSTPRLWCNITVNVEKPNFALLNHQIACCRKAVPLHIHLFATSRSSTHSSPRAKEVMSLVTKLLHRTASLCLNLPDDFLWSFSSVSDPERPKALPLLEELHVHCPNPFCIARLRLAIEPPRPRRVLLDWFPQNHVLLDWTNVSSLTLDCSRVNDKRYPELLASKNLKHLSLSLKPGEQPSVETLVVSRSIQDLTLGRLNSAKFILMAAIFPSLRTLEIEVDEMLTLGHMICGFLNRSECPLQILSIYESAKNPSSDTGERAVQTLINILELTNTLQELTLRLSSPSYGKFAEPLVQRLWLRDKVFLPCLQTLSLRTKFNLPIRLLLDVMAADAHIPEMANRARPLHKLVLELCMPLGKVGIFPQDVVLRILQLRKAGKSISITCSLSWDFSDGRIDRLDDLEVE